MAEIDKPVKSINVMSTTISGMHKSRANELRPKNINPVIKVVKLEVTDAIIKIKLICRSMEMPKDEKRICCGLV